MTKLFYLPPITGTFDGSQGLIGYLEYQGFEVICIPDTGFSTINQQGGEVARIIRGQTVPGELLNIAGYCFGSLVAWEAIRILSPQYLINFIAIDPCPWAFTPNEKTLEQGLELLPEEKKKVAIRNRLAVRAYQAAPLENSPNTLLLIAANRPLPEEWNTMISVPVIRNINGVHLTLCRMQQSSWEIAREIQGFLGVNVPVNV